MRDYDYDSDREILIRVIGIGGGGGNAVNNMIRSGLSGVDFVCANTDAQSLQNNLAEIKLQLGMQQTKGLGAGANPDIGRAAANEDYDKIRDVLEGSGMVFVTAGLGGGTGTGAAPVIARIAKQEVRALTVAVVTKPFLFEGKKRQRQAEEGIQLLRKEVDSLIIIPNQKLLSLKKDITFVDAFRKADDVLLQAVRGISDLIKVAGLINLDFADVETSAGRGHFHLRGPWGDHQYHRFLFDDVGRGQRCGVRAQERGSRRREHHLRRSDRRRDG